MKKIICYVPIILLNCLFFITLSYSQSAKIPRKVQPVSSSPKANNKNYPKDQVVHAKNAKNQQSKGKKQQPPPPKKGKLSNKTKSNKSQNWKGAQAAIGKSAKSALPRIAKGAVRGVNVVDKYLPAQPLADGTLKGGKKLMEQNKKVPKKPTKQKRESEMLREEADKMVREGKMTKAERAAEERELKKMEIMEQNTLHLLDALEQQKLKKSKSKN